MKINQIHSLVFVAAVFLLNVLLKILFLDARDIALDEPFSIFHSQESLSALFNYSGPDMNPPLYFILLHYWTAFFGIDPFSVRLLSVLFSAVTAGVIFQTGERFLNRFTGIVASLVFTLSTLHIFFSHDARTYTLFALLNALALYLYLAILAKPNHKINYLLLFFVNLALIYAHYFGFFVVGIQILFLLFLRDKKPIWKGVLAAAIAACVCYIPHFQIPAQRFLQAQNHEAWIYPAPALTEFYGNLNIFLNNKYCMMAAILVFAVLLTMLFKRKETTRVWRDISSNLNLKIVLAWFLVPYTLMFLISFKTPMFIDRYILYTSVPFYLGIAAFIYSFTDNKAYRLAAAGLLISAMALTVNLNPDNNRRLAEAVRLIKTLKKENSLIIIAPEHTDVGFAYHYNRDYFTDHKNTRKMLENENIFPLSSPNVAEDVLSKHPAEDCIYFQAENKFSRKEDPVLQAISKKYSKHSQKNIFEIFTIHYFSH